MAALLIGLAIIVVSAVVLFITSRKETHVPSKAADFYGAVVKDVDGTKHFGFRYSFSPLSRPPLQRSARFFPTLVSNPCLMTGSIVRRNANFKAKPVTSSDNGATVYEVWQYVPRPSCALFSS